MIFIQRTLYILISFLCVTVFGLHILSAQSTTLPKTEDDYYKIVSLPVPEGIVMEVGGLALLPNGDLGVATRRGDVWIVENPYMDNQAQPYFRHHASGLHEILGLAYKEGTFYLAQRGELTRLWDKNGDGMADFYESIYAWPLSGHYHEYSYGPVIDPDGNMFVTGNVAFGDVEWWSGESRVPWRGWTMRISPEGEMEPWATGMRSPCGLGWIDGEFFYADNQGDWQGSGGLTHVEKGDFTGHPAGLRWADRPESPVKIRTHDIYSKVDPRKAAPGQTPQKPEDDSTQLTIPFFEVAEKMEGVKTPAVWLPHSVLGISTSEIIVDKTEGAFGPFSGQVLIGDQGQSKIVRVALEKVNGVYQGVAFPFREGFASGVLRMEWGKDGSLFVGETNRGWGSAGPANYGLQRLVWTGKTPFEMKTVKAMPDGFEIEFTQPVDKKAASNPDAYQVTSFIYKYHPVYGSPVVNDESCFIRGVKVSKDGMKARIVVDNLRKNYIHEITATGIQSYFEQDQLLHPTAYYTLKEIPKGAKLNIALREVPKDESAHKVHEAHAPIITPDAPKAKAPTAVKTQPKAAKALAKRQTSMPSSWGGKVDQTVQLATKPGLKYDKTLITVKAGSNIKWTFNNNDDMPHNCVIVGQGKAAAVGDKAIRLGVKGVNMSYIPQTSDVLNHTKLLSPGSSESIYLVAPTKPGNYTFVCTVPGHAAIMHGVLKVVK